MAFSLAGGILFTYLLFYYGIPAYLCFTAVPVAAVIFIIVTAVSKKISVILCCLAVAAAFLVGTAYSAFSLLSYQNGEIAEDASYSVGGTVCETGRTDAGATYLVLSGVYADGVKLGGKTVVYLGENAGEYCDTGDSVAFVAVLYRYDLFVYGGINYRALDGIKYYCTVNSGLRAQEGFSLFGSVRSRIYAVLSDHIDGETAAVVYAMLTGNTDAVSEGTLSSFRYGGIAHIFAVSGLHIGVLYAVLGLFLKKARVNKYLSATVKIFLIIFYAGVCGFSPSSLRAAIMCSVLAVTGLVHKKYDALCSLSYAVIILLLIDPLYLFGAGFILSVSAALGIVFLSRPLQKMLGRLPRKLSGSIAVGISAQIATFPALLLTFGYVSAAGFLLNVVVLPVLSALYVALFLCVVICAAVPSAGIILPAVCLPLQLFIGGAVSAGFENALISGFGGWWLPFALLPAVIALSDKFNINRLARAVFLSVSVAAFAFCAVAVRYVPYGSLRVTASAYYGGGMVLIRSSYGAVLVVTEDINAGRLSFFLSKNGINSVGDLIILGGEECLQAYFGLNVAADNIYLSAELIRVENAGSANVRYFTEFSLYGADYAFADSYGLIIDFSGVRIGICAGEDVLPGSYNLLFSVYENKGSEAVQTVYFNRPDGVTGDYNIYDCGDLHFTVKNGKISKTGLTPAAR